MKRYFFLMANVNTWSFNIGKDASLVAEKQWVVTVLRKPTTAAATGNAGSDTTGPLGSGGSANATYTHGDGTATGFASPLDAVQRALILVENDRVLNGD